jgi:hypothetical protein
VIRLTISAGRVSTAGVADAVAGDDSEGALDSAPQGVADGPGVAQLDGGGKLARGPHAETVKATIRK